MEVNSTPVNKLTRGGMTAVTIPLEGCYEHYLSLDLTRGGESSLERIETFLKEHGAKALLALSFGGVSSGEAMPAVLRKLALPVMRLDHDDRKHFPLTGVQIFAVSGCAVRELKAGGTTAGYAFNAGGTEYAYLSNLGPAGAAASQKEQVRETYENMLAALEQANMDFSHVARTWFYLDRLLEWYKEFNEARTGFMSGKGVFQRFSPASTGIGACNPAGTFLSVSAFAVKPSEGEAVFKVVSPLQCEALKYKSAFSRAVEIHSGNLRRLLISGTASIAPDGASVHTGDVEKQIQKTMEVVKAILDSRGMGWENVARSIIYFKEEKHLPLFSKYCREAGIPELPGVPAFTTVCRGELLFEIELDAVSADKRGF
ncbi:MAG: hypothetical protein WCI43_06000 [Candidatus Firestonebacteria bacterium]